MDKKLLPEAEQYTKRNNLRQIWRKFVRVMACVVVFCTTYALILPAITMEKDLVCGMEEHTHAESCYTQVTTVQTTALSCTYESEGGHVHDDACYQTAEPVLICGQAEAEAHTHGADCYDAEGTLVCALAETEGHAHADGCWQTPEAELICGQVEVILHSHAEECYDAEGVLTCTQPVLEEHVHGESCFTVTEEAADTETLTCGQEESEEHTHTALCYGTWELVCEMAEHTHTEECYPAADATEEPTQPSAVDQVISLIDEMPSADEIDAKIEEFEEAEDYEGEEAWLTQAYQQVAYVYSRYSALTEEEKTQVTNVDKLLELEYIWSVTEYKYDYWSAPTVIQDAAKTSEFIELNLYDYGYNINDKYNTNDAWPGFQWNGGAYMYSNTNYNRHAVDFIDFGNSLITDMTYGSSS